jgi:hypothetical protein
MRFYSFVAMAFVTAFVVVSWASRGFPVRAPHFGAPQLIAPLQPSSKIPVFGDPARRAESDRRDWVNSKTLQSDNDSTRDAARMATLQAANAYVLSPCDATMKANLVAALSSYAKAYQEVLQCDSTGPFGLARCPEENREAARIAFTTPLDANVVTAIQAAYGKGGIGKNDFPKSLQLMVGIVARSVSDQPSVCTQSSVSR